MAQEGRQNLALFSGQSVDMWALILLCALSTRILAFRAPIRPSSMVGPYLNVDLSLMVRKSMKLGVQCDDEFGDVSEDFRSGFISILGNPNVGKSTLMNGILNERLCITSHKPQTTRHRILGILTDSDDKYQLVFSDTPGMLVPSYKLQEAMTQSVRGAASDADIIVLVTDVYGDALIDTKVFKTLQISSKPCLIVVNKIDLLEDKSSYDALLSSQSMPIDLSTYHDDSSICDEGHDGVLPKKKKTVKSLFKRYSRLNMSASSSSSGSMGDSKLFHKKGKKQKNDQDDQDGTDDQKTMNDIHEYMALVDNPDVSLSSSPLTSAASKSRKKLTSNELIVLWAERLPRGKLIFASASEKWGIDSLISNLVDLSPQGPKYFPSDTLTNRDERFFAAEIIREAIFESYSSEIPYSCETRIELFRDKSDNLTVIEALIIVSRDTQKKILIGKGGHMIKSLGILARQRLETFLLRKVHLSLRVKVDSEWRQNEQSLTKYGYISDDYG